MRWCTTNVRVIAAYGDRVVMKETLAEALLALFAPSTPGAPTGAHVSASAAAQARDALDHYNQALKRLKSGDWSGFGTQLDEMRELLENLSRQSTDH
jgi:uncharacterized membrane protein (UPF0182 family)